MGRHGGRPLHNRLFKQNLNEFFFSGSTKVEKS
jgi:hypothetical protein